MFFYHFVIGIYIEYLSVLFYHFVLENNISATLTCTYCVNGGNWPGSDRLSMQTSRSNFQLSQMLVLPNL